MKTIVSEEHFCGNAACVLFRNHKIEKNAQNNTFFTAFVAILVGIDTQRCGVYCIRTFF